MHTKYYLLRGNREFATQYELGDELLFNEEMSLLFNIAFYALSIGDWKQSASVWKRLSGLRVTRTDLGKVSALPVNKAKQDQEEIDGDSPEDHLLHILTFSISSTRVKDRRSDPQFPKISEFNFGSTSSSKLAQDLRNKARAVSGVVSECYFCSKQTFQIRKVKENFCISKISDVNYL